MRFNREVDIPCDVPRREHTLQRIRQERAQARAWLVEYSQFFKAGMRLPEGEPEGSNLLYADTKAYMTHRELADLEALFTRQYVSNLGNEAVKAHRIAAAQLGLAPYRGKILRDPSQTAEAFSLDRRATHLLVRMGFVQAIFEQCGRQSVVHGILRWSPASASVVCRSRIRLLPYGHCAGDVRMG